VAIVLGVLAGTGPASAQQARDVGEPDVAARAWVLTDLRSGDFLAGEDASRELPIASTTKIMEALVVLEYAMIEAPYQRNEIVDLVAKGDVAGLVDASPNVKREVELVGHPPLSARAGTRLGRVVVSVDGREVGETTLVAERGYEKPSLGQRLWYTVGGFSSRR
jgi:hypothetical protein